MLIDCWPGVGLIPDKSHLSRRVVQISATCAFLGQASNHVVPSSCVTAELGATGNEIYGGSSPVFTGGQQAPLMMGNLCWDDDG